MQRGIAGKWVATGDPLVQQHAEREDVARRCHRVAEYLLGRHVLRRAHDHAGSRHAAGDARLAHARRQQSRDAEVHHLHVAVIAHHDVLGLDVPMNDARVVRGAERARNLDRDLRKRVQRALPLEQEGAQRSPLHQLHHDDLTAADLTGLVDRDDVRMVQRRGCPRFAVKALQRVRLLIQAIAEDLDRHLPAEARVPSSKDVAHTPRSQWIENGIRADLGGCVAHAPGRRRPSEVFL